MSLQPDRTLVYAFFENFARAECAMKFGCYCRNDRERAAPDWSKLRERLGPRPATSKNDDLSSAIEYLVTRPPEVQLYEKGKAEFRSKPLTGKTRGEKALEAMCRVRNNLFHGGKHTGHSNPEERDQQLLQHALTVLLEAVKLDEKLCNDFESLA